MDHASSVSRPQRGARTPSNSRLSDDGLPADVARARHPSRAQRVRRSGPLVACYILWVLILGDPLRWVAYYGARPILQIPTALLIVTLIGTALSHRMRFIPPLVAFALYAVLSVPVAYNIGYAIPVAKVLTSYCGLAILTVTVVRTAREAVPIVVWGLLFQYTWWTLVGAIPGHVFWHTLAYNNYDSFGPMMAIALGSSYFMALSVKERNLKIIAFATTGGCIIGLISSYARGAVVAGVATLICMFLRSKNKLRTAGLAIAGAVVVFFATNVLFTNASREDANPNFWIEMSTIADTGGTRRDRDELRAVARIEWRQNPIFGVGPGNFGPYAAEELSNGQLEGIRSDPGRLYTKALHNMFYQILSEFGTVGVLIFLWLLWDFSKRNRALRKRDSIDIWASRTGGQFDLRNVSLALEAGMVGYLVSGYFYNQIFDVNWFYSLITINTLLFQVTRPALAHNSRLPHFRLRGEQITGHKPRLA